MCFLEVGLKNVLKGTIALIETPPSLYAYGSTSVLEDSPVNIYYVFVDHRTGMTFEGGRVCTDRNLQTCWPGRKLIVDYGLWLSKLNYYRSHENCEFVSLFATMY